MPSAVSRWAQTFNSRAGDGGRSTIAARKTARSGTRRVADRMANPVSRRASWTAAGTGRPAATTLTMAGSPASVRPVARRRSAVGTLRRGRQRAATATAAGDDEGSDALVRLPPRSPGRGGGARREKERRSRRRRPDGRPAARQSRPRSRPCAGRRRPSASGRYRRAPAR